MTCKPQILIILVAAACCTYMACPAWAGLSGGTMVYSNDFEDDAPRPEWSDPKVDRTPTGRRFLGRFDNQAKVELRLGKASPVSPDGLGPHESVTIAFDLFIIHSWDGCKDGDQWSLAVEGGPTLLKTSFANPLRGRATNPQSFPGVHPSDSHPARTGAVEVNTLGYWRKAPRRFGDSVYRLRFTFPHADDSLVLRFAADGVTGRGRGGIRDESWGLDNVSVWISPKPAAEAAGTYLAKLPAPLQPPAEEPVPPGRDAVAKTAPAAERADAAAMQPPKELFELVDLGQLSPTHINNAGVVVGSRPVDGKTHACIWQDGQLLDLGTFGGSASNARGINNRGEVVGYATLPDGRRRAFLWSPAQPVDGKPLPVMIDLGPFGHRDSMAVAINDGGWVAVEGDSSDSKRDLARYAAYLWHKDHGARQVLVPGRRRGSSLMCRIRDVNNQRQVAGWFWHRGGSYEGFIWQDGRSGGVGKVAGWRHSAVQALNGAGRAVGWASSEGGAHDRASHRRRETFLAGHGSLGTFGGPASSASDIHDSGMVVGYAETKDEQQRAFLWYGGTMHDLNDLTTLDDGWVLLHARAINLRGQIVGQAAHGDQERGFLLNPILGELTPAQLTPAETPDGATPQPDGAAGDTPAANLIANGGFEQGRQIGPGHHRLDAGSTALEGWEIVRGSIDYVGPDWISRGGSRCVDLEGYSAFGGVRQSFETEPGRTYVMQFDVAGNTDGPPVVKRLRAEAAGQSTEVWFDTIGRSKADLGWRRETWSFTATGPRTTLTFRSAGTAGGHYGPLLDNVAVRPK